MDAKKIIIIVSSVCLAGMAVYFTLIRKPDNAVKTAQKPTATADVEATAEIEEANPGCPEYDKALVKTARIIKNSATWENKGVPYVITGDIVIAKGAVFTVKPGVIIKLIGRETDFICKGKFVSKGTKDKPVIFTSIKDDTGGDTNCDDGSSKPAAGDYGSVQFLGQKSGVYEVRYAGGGK